MSEIIQLNGIIECGKCHILSGDVDSITGTVNIEYGYVYNSTIWVKGGDVGSLDATGAFAIEFTRPCPEQGFPDLFPATAIRWIGTADITFTSLVLAESCQQYLCSECFTLVNPECDNYHLIEYSHDSDAFNLRYVNANFRQQIMINARITPIDYPYPVEEIFKFANGIKKPIKTDSEEIHEVVSKQLPDYMHDALRVALKHENLTLDGESICKVEGNYTPELNIEDGLQSQSVFQIQYNPQNIRADYC